MKKYNLNWILIHIYFSLLNYSQSYDIGKMEKSSAEPEMLVSIMLNIAQVGSEYIVYVIVAKL